MEEKPMKKYILMSVVFILVLSVVGIARSNPAWASPQPVTGVNSSGAYAQPAALITINGNGIYNVGGVCTIEVEFKGTDLKLIADAEVPITESQVVPFNGLGELLYPGCHFVHYKLNAIVNPMNAEDGSAKVCFGASADMLMTIYYYLDTPTSGSRVWSPLASTLEDNGRLICAPAKYTGVYMPVGRIMPRPGSEQAGANAFFPDGAGGSVLPPPPYITITGSGTYAVGGICLITARYKITGLSDTVEVEYPDKHFTEDTLTVPSEAVVGLFYFPGCHVVHYRDQRIKDEMTRPEGDWQICFAAIPEKIMTIYYYRDNLSDINPPWTSLVTRTENGMACADLVDFSAVYAPVGK
jgi:hypothetical protein